MSQAFVMVLREGFESFLIVAIILSYLKKTNRQALIPSVYGGIALSILVSFGLGYFLSQGVNQPLWEGVLGLVTMVMVGSLVIHMWRTAPRMRENIHQRLEKAAKQNVSAHLAVFLVTVLMITREGMETALMLLQVRQGEVIGGILLGLVAAASMAWVWSRYGHLINIKRFFQVTGIFLILFMFQVAIYSFHEFSEAGLLPQSEAIHTATEPFSPVGRYGQWFSLGMVGVCGLWLFAAWRRDRHSQGALKA